jgi:hypothetical protein
MSAGDDSADAPIKKMPFIGDRDQPRAKVEVEADRMR